MDAALADTPFPATCQHQAARLVNGARPWTDTTVGEAFVDPKMLVIGDLTGDGVDDAALVGYCTAGGVDWGAMVLVLTMSRSGRVELLGTVFTTDIKGPGIVAERPGVDSLRYDGGTLSIQVRTQMRDDSAAGPSLPVDVKVGVVDGRVQVDGAQPRWDEGTSVRALAEGTEKDYLGSAGSLHAVAQHDVANSVVAGTIQGYLDKVVEPKVRECYSKLSDVPWHQGTDDSLALSEEGSRFCLATAPASDEALVMAVARRSAEKWTVVGASTGTV